MAIGFWGEERLGMGVRDGDARRRHYFIGFRDEIGDDLRCTAKVKEKGLLLGFLLQFFRVSFI